MQPQNPEYQQFVKAIYSEAAFVNELGLHQLICRAEVIKPGHSFSFSQADVYALQGNKRNHVARATITLAVVDSSKQEYQ